MHGKARIERGEAGQSTITPRDGVTIERESPVRYQVWTLDRYGTKLTIGQTNFVVSVPALAIQRLPVKFPKQQFKPPYPKASALTVRLMASLNHY